MYQKDTSKYPRLYYALDLTVEALLEITDSGHHYLRNVLRSKPGDMVRLFNGRDGEWLCEIMVVDKKKTVLKAMSQLREQAEQNGSVTLYFAPIKKQRLDTLIEKAVELGVTDLIPVITSYTENRKPNMDKLRAHIIEAAEQCERLALARLHDAVDFETGLRHMHDDANGVYFPVERHEAKPIHDCQITAPCGFFIGPEGGFSETEKQHIESTNMERRAHGKISEIVSLGDHVLRSETAALFCLSQVKR